MMNAVNFDAITRIYSGPERGCRCGCLGTYAERGTRAFKIRLKKFQERLAATSGVTQDNGGTYLDLAQDGRSLCAYFGELPTEPALVTIPEEELVPTWE